MENNAIMQRVMMLSEMWAETITKNPELPVYAWVGASSVEFKMIKGFVIYQTSLEKTLQDKVLCLTQPFEPDQRAYGEHLTTDLHNYFTEWNKNPSLTAETDIINWHPGTSTANKNEAISFLADMKLLAEELKVSDGNGDLVLALFPNSLTDTKAFSKWIEELIVAGIPNYIRIMLYESRDSMYFKSLAKSKPESFMYLYPDLDIAGAMNQILEDTKAKKNSPEDKDRVSFQQALIKMNEAIGYSDEDDINHYKDTCLNITGKYNWYHQQALVYFFMHSYYASLQRLKEAHHAIDTAIDTTLRAAESDVIQQNQTQYQYYIAKGNLHFMSKEFDEAAAVYRKCLMLERVGANVLMLAGIHQMLGNSLRKSADKAAARLSFEQGWQLLSSDGEDTLKENTMAMFYAKDMLSVADQQMLNAYKPLMERLWGKNWINNLEGKYKELQKN